MHFVSSCHLPFPHSPVNLITSQNVKFTEFLHPLEASISESFVFLLFGPFLVEYAFAFIAPVYSIQIIIEKEKKLKEYLMMNSLRRWVFWLAAALGDFIFYAIIATIGLIALAIARVCLFQNLILTPDSIYVGQQCCRCDFAFHYLCFCSDSIWILV